MEMIVRLAVSENVSNQIDKKPVYLNTKIFCKAFLLIPSPKNSQDHRILRN